MDAQETKIFALALILVVVIGTIIIYFFISMIRQQRINLELKKQNLIAEINSIEKERTRMAADLHDELSPMLSSIKLRVSTLEVANEEDKIQQETTNEHLNELIKKMREISFDMMPVTLQRKGLAAALNELSTYTTSRHPLKIEVKAESIQLDEKISIHLYRIAKEIIHNTLKHADASLLQIELFKTASKIIFLSKDNGKGFDYDKELKDGGGNGLRNLLSRTDVLEGDLFIDSKKGKGTVYTIEIPLKNLNT